MEIIAQYQKNIVPPISEMANSIQQDVQPTIDVLNSIQAIIQPLIEAVAPVIANIASYVRPMIAVEKLRNHQYVYWLPLEEDFVENIICADDVDDVLFLFSIRDEGKPLNGVIESCKQELLIKEHNLIFSQAVDAYRHEAYDLSIVGLLAVLDGILSEFSGDNTTRMKQRMEEIVEELDNGNPLQEEEYAVLMLGVTFYSTVESLSKSIDFSIREPEEINRHWIMHGRSVRKKTPLQCIKIIHCIYGAILINNLSQ